MKSLKEGVAGLRRLAEAEGEYSHSLEKIKQHLDHATRELHAMLKKPHDGVVSPREIKDMKYIEGQVKQLQKFIDDGIESSTMDVDDYTKPRGGYNWDKRDPDRDL